MAGKSKIERNALKKGEFWKGASLTHAGTGKVARVCGGHVSSVCPVTKATLETAKSDKWAKAPGACVLLVGGQSLLVAESVEKASLLLFGAEARFR